MPHVRVHGLLHHVCGDGFDGLFVDGSSLGHDVCQQFEEVFDRVGSVGEVGRLFDECLQALVDDRRANDVDDARRPFEGIAFQGGWDVLFDRGLVHVAQGLQPPLPRIVHLVDCGAVGVNVVEERLVTS